MEVRIPQPKELEGPEAAAVSAPPTDTPSPPPAPRDDDDAAPVPLYSAEESSDEEEFDFEFPFVSRDSPAGTAAPADELFADGRIRPFYPVFGRAAAAGGGRWTGGKLHAAGSHEGAARPAPAVAPPRVRGQLGRLFLEETRERNSSTSSTASTASSSSSSAAMDDDRDGLEGAAPESYCVWRSGSSASASSSPRPPRKSGSTGSMARWRRISDLVVGRSHSDGKEKFLFFATPPPHEAPTSKDKPKPKSKPAPAPTPAGGRKPTPTTTTTEVDTVTAAHRIAYLAKGGGVVPGGTPRRTFLPYREELVGFFANVNGISRSHQHPF
ncbi:unnamed protein product [Urochloa humidicola]